MTETGAGRRGTGMRALIALAVVVAVGVAVLGGVRSFEAVSARFGSPLVPLTADGMIVACTALRLAALTRGWRLPGSLLITYVFIVGTIWLNVATATGWSDAVAHGLAPAAYAVLVELLAHMLRLHLRLTRPRVARVSALTWATSPVITTRVWLHLARTGGDDPVAARALVQQLVRMRSRLRTICPDGWHPFDGARPARTAALHTIRDGLLSAADVAALLPDSDQLTPSELLARIDTAALGAASASQPGLTIKRQPELEDAPHPTSSAGERTAPTPPVSPHQLAPVHLEPGDRAHAPSAVHRPEPVTPGAGRERGGSSAGGDGRTDAELVAELHVHSAERNGGRPLSGREIRRVLGVGTPRATRLRALAGWKPAATPRQVVGAHPGTPTTTNQLPDLEDLASEMSDA